MSQDQPTLLVDADTLIFAAASAVERIIQWSSWQWTWDSDTDEAINHLHRDLARIKEELGSDKVIMALSDKPKRRWRDKYLASYKSNRKDSYKPIAYKPLREYCHEVFDTYQWDTLEGDDVLGILATHPTLIEGEKIVVSIDKDLKTIPGTLYRYDRKETLEISEEEADRFFFKQALMGDRTDGYKGCPGVGPVTADKVLDACEDPAEWWDAVVETYREKGLGEQVALDNARVARICRWTDYDYEKEEVILWTPPQK